MFLNKKFPVRTLSFFTTGCIINNSSTSPQHPQQLEFLKIFSREKKTKPGRLETRGEYINSPSKQMNALEKPKNLGATISFAEIQSNQPEYQPDDNFSGFR